MKKAVWMQPDGAGGFEKVYFETSADMVKYSDTTVAKVLEDLPLAEMSDFMRGVLAATDDAAARQVLNINKDPFFDECGIEWVTYNTTRVSVSNAKFDKALQNNISGLYFSELTFGGADFTVDFWAFISASAPSWATLFNTVLPAGAAPSQPYYGAVFLSRYNANSTLNVGAYDAGATSLLPDGNNEISSVNPVGALRHYELNYSHEAQVLRVFVDGSKVAEFSSVNIERAARYVGVGINFYAPSSFSNVGAISEFRISDGIVRHSENFTPPTEKYALDEYTISLLHFD